MDNLGEDVLKRSGNGMTEILAGDRFHGLSLIREIKHRAVALRDRCDTKIKVSDHLLEEDGLLFAEFRASELSDDA